jgi:L-fuconolactonase
MSSSREPVSALPNPHPDAAWLALRSEPVLEPDLPIIDAHHHLWHGPHPRYLFDDILGDVGDGHTIEATVFVEARSMYRENGPDELKRVGEVEFANGVAAMSASGQYGPTRICAAIVGHADLALGSKVEPVLRALQRAGGDRFRGIRHNTARDPEVRLQAPEGLMRTPAFREGFACLQGLGMTFDAWLYHPQLGDLVDLMAAFPNAMAALNHAGGRIGIGSYAGRRDEVWAQWAANMRQLAAFPNLHVKLGGLGMALAGYAFHERPKPPTSDDLADAWRPQVEACLDLFGPRRCMFQSNFPVDKASFGYRVLWNAFKKVTASLDRADRAALFRDTAASFYGLSSLRTPERT